MFEERSKAYFPVVRDPSAPSSHLPDSEQRSAVEQQVLEERSKWPRKRSRKASGSSRYFEARFVVDPRRSQRLENKRRAKAALAEARQVSSMIADSSSGEDTDLPEELELLFLESELEELKWCCEEEDRRKQLLCDLPTCIEDDVRLAGVAAWSAHEDRLEEEAFVRAWQRQQQRHRPRKWARGVIKIN